MERDYFMTSAEALEFGIIDKIVERRASDEAEEGGKKETKEEEKKE